MVAGEAFCVHFCEWSGTAVTGPRVKQKARAVSPGLF
jgi:hypothetical protein